MPLTVRFLNRVEERGKGSLLAARAEEEQAHPVPFIPAGLAFRNPPEGRGPQDRIPVFAGKPSGYAEFLAVTRS